MAASRMLGLSEDETISLIQRKNAQNNKRRKTNTSDSAAAGALQSKLAQVAALNAEMPADIDGYTTVANDVIEYGDNYNTDTSQQFGGINKDGRIANVTQSIEERERASGKRDPNVFQIRDRDGNVTQEVYVPDGQPTPGEFVEAAKSRDFGIFADSGGASAGASVQRELNQRLGNMLASGQVDPRASLTTDNFPGIQAYRGGYDINGNQVPSTPRDVAYLAAQLDQQANPKVARDAEQSLVREMVRRDAQNVDLDVARDNELIAHMQARMARNTLNRSAPIFDQMGNITKIGHAKIASDFNVNIPVPERETEPNSLPITTAETLNSPVTDNRFSGPLQRQEQWLVDHAPGFRVGGSFNDYPQVSIDAELGNLSTGLGKIRIGGEGIAPGLTRVRGIDDLQAAVDAVVALSADKGQGFTRFEDGKNVTATNPGITEVLQKAGYNDNRTDSLARALFAIEAGRRSPVNQTKKELFAEGISGTNRPVEGGGTHESLGGGTVPIARAGRQKTGKGREVASVLQALQGDLRADTPLTATELADARRPYIGAAEGQPVPRARFLSAADASLTPDQRIAKHGAAKGGIANQVEKRALEARAAKEASLIPRSDPTTAAFRARDQEFDRAGEARNQADSRRALLQAAEDQGKSLVGKGQMLLGGHIVPGGMTGRNVVPESITGAADAFSAPKADPVFAQKAAVNQRPPVGISFNEMAPDPWTTPPATAGGFTERRMPASMLNQLAQLNSGPTQGPRTPGIRQKIMNSIKRAPSNFVQAPRGQRYGAAAGGAALAGTGLSALIGGERDRREEGQY